MSNVVYRDAKLLVGGTDLSADLYELAVEYSAEMLEATTFGATTRIVQGGLLKSKVSGKGYFRGGDGALEQVAFSAVGTDGTVIAVFPDGITEGATAAGRGYAMLGTLGQFDIGGPVGSLLDIAFEADGRDAG